MEVGIGVVGEGDDWCCMRGIGKGRGENEAPDVYCADDKTKLLGISCQLTVV
jgi:hypothetical protein